MENLFNYKSLLTQEEKTKILNWYISLSDEQRTFVDCLRNEARLDEEDLNFNCQNLNCQI